MYMNGLTVVCGFQMELYPYIMYAHCSEDPHAGMGGMPTILY